MRCVWSTQLWRSGRLWSWASSSTFIVGCRDQTQVTRLAWQQLFLLSHTSPAYLIVFNGTYSVTPPVSLPAFKGFPTVEACLSRHIQSYPLMHHFHKHRLSWATPASSVSQASLSPFYFSVFIYTITENDRGPHTFLLTHLSYAAKPSRLLLPQTSPKHFSHICPPHHKGRV